MHVPKAVAVCSIASSRTSTCWNTFTCSTASRLCSTPTKSVLSAFLDAPAGSLTGQVLPDLEQRRQDRAGTFRAAELCGRGHEWKHLTVILKLDALITVHQEATVIDHSTRMWLPSCLKTGWNKHPLVILTISLWWKCVWLHVLWWRSYFYTFASQNRGIFKYAFKPSHLRTKSLRCREVPGFFFF